MKLIGATTPDVEPVINVLPKDLEEVKSFIASIGKPYIVLHPIAMDVRRMWPVENYAKLADTLVQQNMKSFLQVRLKIKR